MSLAQKQRIKAFVSMLCIFLLMLGVWAIDVGAGCMAGACGLSNGWVNANPTQHYHIGIVLVISAGMILGVNGL